MGSNVSRLKSNIASKTIVLICINIWSSLAVSQSLHCSKDLAINKKLSFIVFVYEWMAPPSVPKMFHYETVLPGKKWPTGTVPFIYSVDKQSFSAGSFIELCCFSTWVSIDFLVEGLSQNLVIFWNNLCIYFLIPYENIEKNYTLN